LLVNYSDVTKNPILQITCSTMWLELPKFRQSIRNINRIVFI